MEMFNPYDEERNWGCRVNNRITWSGYEALILQNELIQIVVLLEKGAEICQFLFKPLDVDFIWHGPNPLKSTQQFVPAGVSQVSSFFDYWSGNWFEVVPNGGHVCEYKGASLGFFAETVNVPWSCRILENTPDIVKIGLTVLTYRLPFLLQKTLTIRSGSPTLWIEERLTNTGNEALNYMWGHHPVIGRPFLDDSCKIYAPDSNVEVFDAEDGPDHRMGLHQVSRWPFMKDRDGNPLDLREMPPSTLRSMDNCYLRDFKEGWIAIHNPSRRLGFGFAWDPQVFRYVWMWQALGGGLGYPWFGRTYNIGIEPWTSYPCKGLKEAIQRGTAPLLGPGESQDVWLTATVFTGQEAINLIRKDGSVQKL